MKNQYNKVRTEYENCVPAINLLVQEVLKWMLCQLLQLQHLEKKQEFMLPKIIFFFMALYTWQPHRINLHFFARFMLGLKTHALPVYDNVKVDLTRYFWPPQATITQDQLQNITKTSQRRTGAVWPLDYHLD